MTYTHLSMDELIIIESYFHQNTPVSKISKQVDRARQTVHNVVTFLRAGHTALDYYRQYEQNKKRCGRKRTELAAVMTTISTIPAAHCTGCSDAKPLISRHYQCKAKENPMAIGNAGASRPSDGLS